MKRKRITIPAGPNKIVPMAKVIKDMRDGRLDYYIPLEEAKKLYKEGKLSWDSTNHEYCEP
jgi:hypothetical protein